MNSVLRNLYRGLIIPWERSASNNPDYYELNRKIEDEKRYFMDKMSLDDCQRFEKLGNIYNQASAFQESEAFCYGMKLGMAIMAEVLTDKELVCNGS